MKTHKKKHNGRRVISRHGALSTAEVPLEIYDAAMQQEPPEVPVEHLDTRKMAGMAHAGETFVPSGDPMGWVK